MSNGNFIDTSTLSDNERRLNKMMGTFNFIRSEKVKKNVQPKLINYQHCSPSFSCENDDLREYRQKKVNLRQPIQTVRKETVCNDNNNTQCSTYTVIYKDNYSQCDNNTLGGTNPCTSDNGSLPTSNVNNINLNQSVTKSKSGNYVRTAKPLIRSGMQPNTAGQQNSGLNQYVGNQKRSTYSYSYRELLNNRKKTTVDKSLAYVTNEGNQSGIFKYGYGGEKTDPICPGGTVVDRLNNKKFYKQGSVDCGSRLERLKLDAIRGQSRCSTGTSQATNSSCNGRYFAGKPRNMNLNFINNNTEILHKKKEQINALRRVRGSMNRNKRTQFNNGGSCCD